MANLTPKKKRDQIPVLIASKRGNISAMARVLKIPRSSLSVMIQNNEEWRTLLADERERMLDDAEDQLGQAVVKGEAWAVCFTLKTQGKERGYSERSDTQPPININFNQVVLPPIPEDAEIIEPARPQLLIPAPHTNGNGNHHP